MAKASFFYDRLVIEFIKYVEKREPEQYPELREIRDSAGIIWTFSAPCTEHQEAEIIERIQRASGFNLIADDPLTDPVGVQGILNGISDSTPRKLAMIIEKNGGARDHERAVDTCAAYLEPLIRTDRLPYYQRVPAIREIYVQQYWTASA